MRYIIIPRLMTQLLVLLAVFSFLGSCKKSSTPFKSYFRMTIDGTRNIDADLEIRANGTNISNALFLYGRWATGELSIELNPYDNTLGEKIVNANLGSPRFILFDNQKQYYAGDNGIFGTVTGSGKITILEISDEFVKGNFQFISGPDFFTNEIRTITNGEFHIKRGY